MSRIHDLILRYCTLVALSALAFGVWRVSEKIPRVVTNSDLWNSMSADKKKKPQERLENQIPIVKVKFDELLSVDADVTVKDFLDTLNVDLGGSKVEIAKP
ncbi:MAG: hypothetical protein WCK57_00600 [Verrucomicrobiae bacterium]